MFESMTKANKLKAAKNMFMEAVDRDVKWQKLAREDFEFRDGKQWGDTELRILEDEKRPALTFNLTKSSIDLIMGMNEDNKVRHRAAPVDPTDGFLADVLNDITDWVSENNDFEAEEDGALESAAICGRGFVAIDFVPDPDRFGEIRMTEVDVPVHEVHVDPACRRPNLEDAAYITWDRWITVEDFKIRYPKVSAAKIKSILESGTSGQIVDTSLSVGDQTQPSFEPEVFEDEANADYSRPLDMNYFDKARRMVRVIHMEYWETYKRYFAFNPEAKRFEEVTDPATGVPMAPNAEIKAEFERVFKQPMTIETMLDKKVKWIQFIGDEILYDSDSPLPYKGFSIVPVFAYRDASKRSFNHFGIVRLIKDPQREINKRWSQALNMLNQQVQPGVYAETDAFVDEGQALASMKEAGAITWVNSGALSTGKLKERTVPAFPQAPMQMEQFSQDIMKKITGINPDLLGQDRGRQEPGVVVRLRQQQGITLLKPLFRGFNQMKKELFKRQLAIIMAYMPDRQVLRILGQNDRYQIDPKTGIITDVSSAVQNPETGEVMGYELQAPLRSIRELEYNIKGEQAPGNMTKRMLELTALLEMSEKFPVPPDQIIEKMEIPAQDKKRWLDYIDQQQQAQAQEQDHQMQMQMEFADREVSVKEQKNEFDFLVDMAKIKQMAEKDEKKIVGDFAKLEQTQQANVLNFAAQMMQVMSTLDAARERGKETNGEGKQSTPKKA